MGKKGKREKGEKVGFMQGAPWAPKHLVAAGFSLRRCNLMDYFLVPKLCLGMSSSAKL